MRTRDRLTVVTAGLFVLLSATQTRAEKFECLVQPYLQVKLSSGVPGILGEVLVDRGDFVKKDQILARLVSDAQEAGYELARARAEFADRRVERNQELYRKQMISIHEKDEMATEAQLLKLEVREVEEQLKMRSIRSPLDGVVVKLHLSAGEYIQQEPMLELARVITLGALRRDESRGAHYKPAFPKRNDAEWLKTTIATWSESGPQLSDESVNISLVEPVERKYD